MFSNVMSLVIINSIYLIISFSVPIIKAHKMDNLILFCFFFFLLGVEYTDTNLILTDKVDFDGRTLLVWQRQKRTYNLGNQYTVFLNFLLFIYILKSCFCGFHTELGDGGPQMFVVCIWLQHQHNAWHIVGHQQMHEGVKGRFDRTITQCMWFCLGLNMCLYWL